MHGCDLECHSHISIQPTALGYTVQELPYDVEDGVAVVTLGSGIGDKLSPWGTKEEEHRLEPRLVLALFDALERAELDSNVQALVLSAEGRFWCNGFDLKWIQQHMDLAEALQQAVELLYARVLQYPKPTLAAINGHACAGGAMLMLAFDFKIMNEDKGFVFMPGIDLGIVYTPGCNARPSSRYVFPLREHRTQEGRWTSRDVSAHDGKAAAAATPRLHHLWRALHGCDTRATRRRRNCSGLSGRLTCIARESEDMHRERAKGAGGRGRGCEE